jgi:isoquinoline 1-oxidoreductase
MEQDGVYHIFVGTQWATRCVPLIAEAVGVDPSNVVIHQQYLGGFFGRRGEADEMVQAAMAAKELGRPVKLIYSREDDIRMDFHRSPTVQRINAGVDADGKYVAMEHAIAGGWSTKRAAPGFLGESVDKKGKVDSFSVNGSDFWYTVPNHHVRAIENETATQALPPGFWRSVAPGWTFFATESYIDEMARKIGKDPLLMRVDMLDATGKNAGAPPNSVGGAKRLRNTLMAAAGRAGFGTKPLAENTGMGLSCISAQERGSPSWTACVAEVHVDPSSGDPTVQKLTIAMDVGTVVNPDGAKAQIEGAALWGVSQTLHEQLSMSDGGIDQGNFDEYEMLRMDQVPEIDIVLIEQGQYPAGIGEPATACVPAAIANAIDDAVGARVRSLPITADAVKAAMA